MAVTLRPLRWATGGAETPSLLSIEIFNVLTVAQIDMTKLFDPDIQRRKFESFDLGYLSQVKFDEGAPMGNFAISDLRRIVRGLLVGLDEVCGYIEERVSWLDFALENHEACGSLEYHKARLFRARALFSWIKDGTCSADDWSNSAMWHIRRINDPEDPLELKYVLSDELPLIMLALFLGAHYSANGDYEPAIAFYEKYAGSLQPELRKINKPREYAYALCLACARGSYDLDDLHLAGKKMLSRNMNAWLNCAGEVDAAQWLHVVYSLGPNRDIALGPRECLLKAYDHMKHIKIPPLFLSKC